MSVGIKADPSGTFGELLLGGSPVVRFDSGGLTTTTSGQDYYNQANILGLVSQSGGTPTGAIIERGSNANGEYVRFADGTIICLITLTPVAAIDQAFFGGFRSAPFNLVLPAQVLAPRIVGEAIGASAFGSAFASVSTTVAEFYFTSITSQLGSGRVGNAIVVGRWF